MGVNVRVSEGQVGMAVSRRAGVEIAGLGKMSALGYISGMGSSVVCWVPTELLRQAREAGVVVSRDFGAAMERYAQEHRVPLSRSGRRQWKRALGKSKEQVAAEVLRRMIEESRGGLT